MALEVNIHNVQTAILRELLFHRSASFAQLQKPTGLTSDHFNFHISRLVELGFVEKLPDGGYRLSYTGKEYANKLDTDQSTIERQPKTSVILVVWRDSNHSQLLMQQRSKNPFFGYWGYPTGKIRWGETILEAASRELLEETGLSAEFQFHGIYHEIASLENGQQVEDKIFMICQTEAWAGRMIDIEGCHNEWLSLEESRNLNKTFPGFDTVQDIVLGKYPLRESRQSYFGEEF